MAASLLKDRDFRLVAGSVGLSALGDWVAIVALGLHVKELTDSAFAVAALWVCLFGPSVLVAGHAGLLADRVDPRRVLAVVSLLGAAIAAALAFTTALAPALALTAVLDTVSALAGLIGLLALLRMYRGWVPTGPVGSLERAQTAGFEPPAPSPPRNI